MEDRPVGGELGRIDGNKSLCGGGLAPFMEGNGSLVGSTLMGGSSMVLLGIRGPSVSDCQS